MENRIDAGVPRDPHVLGDAFSAKILRRGRRGSEMQAGQPGGENAIQLFGERLVEIPGAQPGFDVRDRNTAVEGGQGAAEGGRRVALHYRHIGLGFGKRLLQGLDDASRGLKQRLPRRHHVQIVIRRYAEGRQDLIEHPAMLTGHADFGRIQLGKRSQLQEQRAELDRFRPRTENEEDGSSQRDAFSLALTLEARASMKVLILNPGSSSLRYGLIPADSLGPGSRRNSWSRSATTLGQPRSCLLACTGPLPISI